MSMTKDGIGYIRHMDELFERRRHEERDNSDFQHEEYRYLEGLKNQGETARKPKQDEDEHGSQGHLR